MIREMIQIRHERTVFQVGRAQPELYTQPSALNAAQAAGIFVSHDYVHAVLEKRRSASFIKEKMLPFGSLDKMNAKGLA